MVTKRGLIMTKKIVGLANDGILLVDEITEMPLNMQGKFLKFIEENWR